jgi:hypothetical protein
LFNGPATVLRCIHVLANISWDDLAYPNFEKQPAHGEPWGGSLGLQSIILGTLSGYSPSNLVLYRLWERDRCCAVNNEYGTLLQSYQPGQSLQEAQRIARQQLVERKCHMAPDRPQDDITEAMDHILRKGARGQIWSPRSNPYCSCNRLLFYIIAVFYLFYRYLCRLYFNSKGTKTFNC